MEEERSIHPTVLIGNSIEEVSKVKRDAPPAHYVFKIESLSLMSEFLTRTGSERYESRDFEVSGYKWKLSFYPDGDADRNGDNHISLYLVLSETNDLPPSAEVNAFFKLFVYDQIQDQYLTVQDVSKKPARFYMMKNECGFPRFLPLGTFEDASSGYLVNDCCIFGAEIFVTNFTGKGECVSITKPERSILFSMKDFSKYDNKVYESPAYDTAGFSWSLLVHSNGVEIVKGEYLSMFLLLKSKTSPEQKVWVDFKLRVKNQSGGTHHELQYQCWYCASHRDWGQARLLLLSDLKDEDKGYMLKDTVIVEIDIIQVVSVDDFS